MLELRILPSIAKVFPKEVPPACEPRFSGLVNEVISFQLAYRQAPGTAWFHGWLAVEIDSPAKAFICLRRVRHVPVRIAAFPDADEHYLCQRRPGLYPDPLMELPSQGLRLPPDSWEALWIDAAPDGALPPGDYPVAISFLNADNGALLARTDLTLHIIGARLPHQSLWYTRWLHTDCLAEWYNVEVFSEDYWRITENYLRCMARRGINTVLTPIHTPPLDTRPGSYRPPVQLVDITLSKGEYTFGFTRLRRWVDLCLRSGMEHFEMAHLFTQWGAAFAPQIHADTPCGRRRIFGWDTPATDKAYAGFLQAYLPALTNALREMGIDRQVIFHISDEPDESHLSNYAAARALVKDLLKDYPVMDALSNVSFYDRSIVDHPIPATSHIDPFLRRNIPGLWTYYCCGQGVDVSNQFIALPGGRTRVLGVQLYKYGIAGFLHWGFNFYYSQFSDNLINPWLDTDCDGFSQAGDGFQVYPGRDGCPVESQRIMLTAQALQDLRALRLLESLSDRETVLSLIDQGIPPLTFSRYPQNDDYILRLRARVNDEIEKRLPQSP